MTGELDPLIHVPTRLKIVGTSSSSPPATWPPLS